MGPENMQIIDVTQKLNSLWLVEVHRLSPTVGIGRLSAGRPVCW